MGFDYNKVAKATRMLLEGIGDDPNRDGLKETPTRVADMYAAIMCGYDQDPTDYLKMFDNDNDYDGPVILRDASFYAYCEHHLQPFYGKLNIAYWPQEKVVGLSKLVRIARVFAKRPQVQERLTKQIADALYTNLEPRWVVVNIQAEHMCMAVRGVRVPGTTTTTIYGHGPYPLDIF